MTRPRDFCLCADDYGMTPGVSLGIREAMDAGAVTATSAMTTSAWWPQEAERLVPWVGRADLGLHVNLTLGAPLGPMPTLAPGGRLPDIGTLLRLSRAGRLPAEEVEAEVSRQYEAFVAALGRAPDHVDGHQHVQVLGAIRGPVLAALRRHRFRGWVRDSGDSPARILRRGGDLKKAIGIAALSHGFRAAADRAGFATNRGFAGFSPFDEAIAYGSEFRRFLRAPGSRHLVMCHPGRVDDPLRGLDPVVGRREQELAFLLSPGFRPLCEAAGLRPAPLSTTPAVTNG